MVEKKELSYREKPERYWLDYAVHGDDWINGFQKPVWEEATEMLSGYGGKTVMI